MASPKQQNAHLESAIGSIISLWFPSKINSQAACTKSFDLQPHAAICLALMTTKSIAASDSLAAALGPIGLNMLEKVESYIVVEYGLDALVKAGYVKLDAAGKKEFAEARSTGTYGHPGVYWTLTSAGARRAAPFYCSVIGKTSEFQKQAIQDMLAANKEAIQHGREMVRKQQQMAKPLARKQPKKDSPSAKSSKKTK